MFRNAKVGDRVWDFRFGWGTVRLITIDEDETYPLLVSFENEDGTYNANYTLDGKFSTTDKNPSLFWDEIKFEIPKKPFNLKEFLKENLEPKEFIKHKDNYFLYWNHDCEIFDYNRNIDYESSQPYFERKNLDEVVVTLNDNKVTIEQLKQVFKELGWL